MAKTSRDDPVLARLEKICLSLPGAVLEFPWGCPHFKVGGKIFCGCGEEKGRRGIGFRVTLPEQALLIQDPRFTVASYVGKYGGTNLSLDGRIDWKEVERFVRRSFELVTQGSSRRPPKIPKSKTAPVRKRRGTSNR